jgi:hypothetical protein
MTIKLIDNAGSLSEDDLKLLTGTDVLYNMIRNRILVVIEGRPEIDWTDLTTNIEGLYHIRELNRSRLYQVWFEQSYDLDQFKKNLYIVKLSLDKTSV